MKNLRIVFEDEDYMKLLEVKKDKGWREFVLENCLKKEGENNGIDNNTTS